MDQADTWPSPPTPTNPAEVRTKVAHDWKPRDVVLVFDGRVLEVFGSFNHLGDGKPASARFHVGCACLKVSEPDRKGRRTVKLCASRTPWAQCEVSLTIASEDWASIAPFLSRIAAAFARG